MNSLIPAVAAASLFTLSICAPAVAAGGKENSRSAVSVKDDGYAQSSIDLKSDALPPKFKGYKCSDIVKGLKSLNAVKDEFETRQQFEDRLLTGSTRALNGSITAVDPMVFVRQKDVAIKYEAESQSFKGSIYLGRSGMIRSENGLFEAEALEVLGKSSRSYEATNGYGAKALVQEANATVCGVLFKTSQGKKSWESLRLNFDFPMEPGQAREAKEFMRIAFVGALMLPYLGTYASFVEPTISSPYASNTTGDAVVMRLDEAWVFNGRTGQIYAKVRPYIK
ncbi:hypothetical protein GCM10010975_26550 [Comamonas phosphati]|nr:hypothetical protein GCM10010975_26550 [Comamonas phosphati]